METNNASSHVYLETWNGWSSHFGSSFMGNFAAPVCTWFVAFICIAVAIFLDKNTTRMTAKGIAVTTANRKTREPSVDNENGSITKAIVLETILQINFRPRLPLLLSNLAAMMTGCPLSLLVANPQRAFRIPPMMIPHPPKWGQLKLHPPQLW